MQNILKTGMMTAIVTLMAVSAPAMAEDGADKLSSTNASADQSGAKDSAESQMIATYERAAELAAWGREKKSAMALLLAGEMMSGISTRDGDMEGSVSGEAKTPDTEAKQEKPELSAETLFAEARALAGADKDLVSRIDRAAKRQSKGRIGGPARVRSNAPARSHVSYTIGFRGGEVARLAVVGDGTTNLDLRVFDENGNLICSETSGSDRSLCQWVPAWTGNFRVVVTNYGSVYNTYTMLTN